MTSTKSSNLFITGCDHNTQWQLPWFVENFKKHNPNAELLIFDFGMNDAPFSNITKKHTSQDKGWFKKPSAMMESALVADKVCWLDTDCEVRANIEDIFEYTEPNKLCMVEDVPWSTRRGETWHNSGVVAFERTPNILSAWATEVSYNPNVGDQEVLHSMLSDPLKRMIHIKDISREYNTLRIDLLDNTAPKNIKVMHWTGAKGNDHIRGLL
tara:strand:- start:2838 stop:3473 length:636 start_codon:yes stop_codon:yes gene_type:complete